MILFPPPYTRPRWYRPSPLRGCTNRKQIKTNSGRIETNTMTRTEMEMEMEIMKEGLTIALPLQLTLMIARLSTRSLKKRGAVPQTTKHFRPTTTTSSKKKQTNQEPWNRSLRRRPLAHRDSPPLVQVLPPP
jgi:hypothetical protein